MGWTSYPARYFTNEKINRKKECDAYFTDRSDSDHWNILKSTMKGATYYAAIKQVKEYVYDTDGKHVKDERGLNLERDIPIAEQKIFAVVFRTATKENKEFFIKVMTEDVGPFYYDCPQNILKNLLSPTDNEYAIEWRKKCREYLAKPSLGKLPIGTKIKFNWCGSEKILIKKAPAYQFKTPWWYCEGYGTYFNKTCIPKDFEIVD